MYYSVVFTQQPYWPSFLSWRAFIYVVMTNGDWISNLRHKPTQKPSRFCFSFDVLIYLFGACRVHKCRCANECKHNCIHSDGNYRFILYVTFAFSFSCLVALSLLLKPFLTVAVGSNIINHFHFFC